MYRYLGAGTVLMDYVLSAEDMVMVLAALIRFCIVLRYRGVEYYVNESCFEEGGTMSQLYCFSRLLSSHRVPGRRYCSTKIVNCIFHLGDGKAVIGFSWVSVLPILNFSGRFTVVSIDFY